MAKILITGSDGSIARHITEELEKKNHQILHFDLSRGMDILNLEQLRGTLKNADLCLHNAAIADLNRSREAPLESWQINMMGSVNVAHACSELKIPVIYISTCCVYGNSNKHPSNEETLPNPSELYASTKLAGEQAFVGYAKMYGLVYSIARIATVFGPGMREALAVHTFFKKAILGEPITIHGTGKQTRTVTYIDDLVEGIVKLTSYMLGYRLRNFRNGQIFNLSTEEEISVNEMAAKIKKITSSSSEIIHGPDRPGQTFKEQIDASKAHKILNWQAKTTFEEGLKKLYAWLIKEKIYDSSQRDLFLGKRIFVGFNSAGAAGLYSWTRQQRQRGLKVDFYGMGQISYNMPVDKLLNFSQNKFLSFCQRLSFFFKILPHYDIWHFNYTESLFYPPLNLLLLKLFGKKIISTFRGSDVEDFSYSINKWGKASPFWYSELRFRSRWKRRLRMKVFTFFSDKVVLIGPWLIPSVDRYDKIIPYSRDITKIKSFKKYQKKLKNNKKIIIFHAPTDPAIKGTQYIKQAFENLAKKYKNIELNLVEKVSHDEVLKQMASSDIVVEQLLLSWYSGTAVEAMALGKPVMSFLDPEYFPKMSFSQEIPIFNTNLWTFERDLEVLIRDARLREEIGRKGEKFAQKYHSAEVIADQYLKLYQEVCE